ncbi:MAG: hypothetical protein KJO38_12095, partial [Gammaproteobacteria bacterium]|nr:hypothetical protein [Gammaproteobacteria bacterium]
MKETSNAARRHPPVGVVRAAATLAAAAALALSATSVVAEHDQYYAANAGQPAPRRCPTQHVHHHYPYPRQAAAYYAPPAPQYGHPYQGQYQG